MVTWILSALLVLLVILAAVWIAYRIVVGREKLK